MHRLVLISFLRGATLAVALLALGVAPGQEPTDYGSQLPRIAPLAPAEAAGSFFIQPGYALSLVAAEPLVHDPVACDFDASGRLFVVEMADYSEQATERLGVIRRLEDRDDDGRYETSTLFAADLSWPTALIVWRHGVFVAAAPDIWFLGDADGDGRAEERRLVFTGLGRGNVQGLVNSLRWGPDLRIHAAASSAAGELRRPDDPRAPVLQLSGRDFSFDPRTLEARLESGGAQHGMSFDDAGRKFLCSNSDHLQLVLFDDRRLARNPFLVDAPARRSIAADGPQAPVFRQSPVEPWRELRTRLRVQGLAPGPVEGGGRAAGYFTSATGLTIVRGDAFDADLRGRAVVADVGSNLIHRKRLDPSGPALVGARIDAGAELVASTDVWFRPVQFANAPDGSLFILDMYREVIEHPASLPPQIKPHLDLTSGRDRGRIWRLAPVGWNRRPAPRLASAELPALVAALDHANAWHRETASRLLLERDGPAIFEPLERLARNGTSLGRLQTLRLLAACNRATDALVLERLSDDDPAVRRLAVQLAERRPDPALRAALLARVDDPEAEVRLELALALGESPSPASRASLVHLARRDAADPTMRTAIQSSLLDGAAEVATELLADDASGVQSLVAVLVRQVGRQGRPADLARLATAIETHGRRDPATAGRLAADLAEGLVQGGAAGGDWPDAFGPSLRALLERRLEQLRATARDEGLPSARRAAAIRGLALARWSENQADLRLWLEPRQPDELRRAALDCLARSTDPGVAAVVLDAWSALSPADRTLALESLVARPDRAAQLLDALERGTFPRAELDPARVLQLKRLGDDAQRRRAERLLGAEAAGRRADVVDRFRPALDLAADPRRGRAVFTRLCANCHRLDGQGHELGPNLAAAAARGPEFLLTNLLDPNREVNPQYINYLAVTTDGRAASGMIASETAAGVTLQRAAAVRETLLRADLDQLQSSGLSLMPEGLERQLTEQDLADLLAYLAASR